MFNQLRQFVKRFRHRARKPAHRARRFRPTLNGLERREVPSALAGPQVVYAQASSPSGGVTKSSWLPPNGLDGDQYAYDGFTLPVTQNITQIGWRGGYTNYLSGAGQSPVFDFTISIYASIAAGIQPDVISQPLAQYTVGGNAGETLVGNFGGMAMYDYKYVLLAPFQAVGGTKYWLQIEASQGVTPTYYWPPDWGIALSTSGDGSYFRSITGGTNGGGNLYQSVAGDTAFTLYSAGATSQATPMITMSSGPFTFDGTTQAATATATGAQGNSINGTFTYSYSQNGIPAQPRNAGTYDVVATFTSSDANYASTAATGTLTINPATPKVTLTGGTFIYDGKPHAAAATVVGSDGITPVSGSLAPTYNGAPTVPTAAGTYAVQATFTSTDSNYATTTTVNGMLSIGAATPKLTISGGPFSNDGAAHFSTATAQGFDGSPVAGSFTFVYTLNGVAAQPISAGTYVVTVTFTSSDANYASATATGTLVILPPAPAVDIPTTPLGTNPSTPTVVQTSVRGNPPVASTHHGITHHPHRQPHHPLHHAPSPGKHKSAQR